MKRNLAVCAGMALILFASCKNPFFPPLKMPADPEVPVISVHPQSAEYPIGDKANDLTVSASVGDGGALSYQWYKNGKNSNEGGTLITDATKERYVPSTDTEGTAYYYVTVTNTLNKKTATADSNTAAIKVYNTGGAAPINHIDVTVTAPTKDSTPDTTATVNGEGYTCGDVSWTPAHNPFQSNTAYTATVTLTANDGYAFAPDLSATINHHEARVVAYAVDTVILSLEFDKTLNKMVTGILIKIQPAKLVYTYGEKLDLSGLVVTLTYEDATSDDILSVNFGTSILTNPESGAELSSTHNGQPIAVSFGSLKADTDALLVKPPPIHSVAVEITRPVNGAAPADHAIVSAHDHFACNGSVSWSPSHNPFQGLTVYTATVTLTAHENYVFANPLTTATINDMDATVIGNTGATVTLTFTFTETDNRVITRIEVTDQPRDMTYTDGGELKLTGLTVRLIYDNGTFESVGFSAFESKGIATEPEHDVTLSHSAHNKQPIVVSYGGHETNTAPLIVVEWPSGLTTPYGKHLSDISLNSYTNNNTGSFAWARPGDSVGAVGSHPYSMRFTPYNSDIYRPLTNDYVYITVYKANPDVTFPVSASIIYGNTLATAAFTGSNNNGVPGGFAYNASTFAPTATGPYSGYTVTFTPGEPEKYNSVSLEVPFTVNKRPLAISVGRLIDGSRRPSHYGGMIPFDSVGGADTVYANTTTIPLTINSLAFTDTITVTPVTTLSTYGLTFSDYTGSASTNIPFSYNGTTVVTETDPIPITFSISVEHDAYYTITINNTTETVNAVVNVNIFDGGDPDRAIPVTNGNITAFNAYVNSVDGRVKNYKLAGPVVLPGTTKNWTMIESFTGSFDGAGYTITNLIASDDGANNYGMFKTIAVGSTVKNVGLINANISGLYGAVGGIAGQNSGTVENCYVSGMVRNKGKNNSYTGGIVGTNGLEYPLNTGNGTVKNCYVTGTVYDVGDASATGGIVGRNINNSTVENCYVSGTVRNILDNTSGTSNSGGIVGTNSGTGTVVQNCVALNSVIETSRDDAAANTALGRVAGSNDGILDNNYGHPSIPMTYDGGSYVPTSTAVLNGKDGAHLAPTGTHDYKDWTFWTSVVEFSDDVWEWGTNHLPILKGFKAPQNHTVSFAD